MSHLHPRRIAILVLIAALGLTTPWPAAALPSSDHEPGHSAPMHSQALAGLWEWLTSLWAEAGCTLDPSGCTNGAGDDDPAESQGDAGCTADPNGAPCERG